MNADTIPKMALYRIYVVPRNKLVRMWLALRHRSTSYIVTANSKKEASEIITKFLRKDWQISGNIRLVGNQFVLERGS